MDPTEKKTLEENIRKQLLRLEKQIADLEEATKPISPENAIGRVSRMDAINNKSVNEAALRQARMRKSGLETALDRIDQPDFGKCKGCGETIPAGRLVRMPESTRCIKCASRR